MEKNTKNNLLIAAAELYAKKGYDNVSIRELTQKVGIKESSVYNHFKNKEDILGTLFDQFIVLSSHSRMSYDKIEKIISFTEPYELLKMIMFEAGGSADNYLVNLIIICENEAYRNYKAAEIYKKYMLEEPVKYYCNLFRRLRELKKIKSDIDYSEFAKYYNYVSLTLSKEYFIEKNLGGNSDGVVHKMIDNIKFFCKLMI